MFPSTVLDIEGNEIKWFYLYAISIEGKFVSTAIGPHVIFVTTSDIERFGAFHGKSILQVAKPLAGLEYHRIYFKGGKRVRIGGQNES